jgi:hypothetical protein
MTINKVNMAISTFKIRYDTDDEFKEAHLNYMKEKIKCSGCGALVSRCNMPRHKQSKSHEKKLLYISDISDYEARKKKINSIYNKKIREIKNEKQRELNKIDKKIKKRLRD